MIAGVRKTDATRANRNAYVCFALPCLHLALALLWHGHHHTRAARVDTATCETSKTLRHFVTAGGLMEKRCVPGSAYARPATHIASDEEERTTPGPDAMLQLLAKL